MTAEITPGHAHEPRHIKATDLFKFNAEPATDKERAAVAEFLKEADAYLAPFAAPVIVDGKHVCFHCGSEFDQFKAIVGLAASIEWGLVHGEGRCTGSADKPCGWPYRGMHYPKASDGSDLFTLQNLFLAYHPDSVTSSKDKAA